MMLSSKLLRKWNYPMKQLYRQYSIVSSTSDNRISDIKPFNEIPSPKGIYGIPKIGSMFLFHPFSKYKLENIHELMDKLHDELGEVIYIDLGSICVVITSNPDDIETVYKNEGKYPRRPALELFLKYVEQTKMERNLSILDGKAWADLRQHIQKKLGRPNAALHYLANQSDVADDLVHQLKTIKQDAVRDLLFTYATESIGVVCFNKRLGILDQTMSEDVKEYLRNSQILFSLVSEGTAGNPLFKYIDTPMYKKFKNATDITYSFGKMHIEECFEKALQMKKDGSWNCDEPNFLMSLLAEDRLSIAQISSIVLDLLVAGTDSTAKTLEIFLYCLATNPEKQHKLYKEIECFMGREGNVTRENLPQMEYLKACFKESMRTHYPIALGSGRILPVDVVLSGYHVPKNTLLLLNNRRLLLNSDYVSKPEDYRPERWLRDETGSREDNIPSIGLIPFSLGVRNCIGRRFAIQEIYLASAKIIQNFKVSLTDEEEEAKMIYHTFGSLLNPPKFKFTQRE